VTDHRIRAYLRALAALAIECADRPELLPLFAHHRHDAGDYRAVGPRPAAA